MKKQERVTTTKCPHCGRAAIFKAVSDYDPKTGKARHWWEIECLVCGHKARGDG